MLNSFSVSPDVSLQTIACSTVLQSAFWHFALKDGAGWRQAALRLLIPFVTVGDGPELGVPALLRLGGTPRSLSRLLGHAPVTNPALPRSPLWGGLLGGGKIQN